MIGIPQHLQELMEATQSQDLWSDERMIAQYVEIERAYLRIQGINDDILAAFNPDYSALKNATARDGVVIPELVHQMRGFCGLSNLHTGMTSQDVIDTARSLSIKRINEAFDHDIHKILQQLNTLMTLFGPRPMMARTRMQAATPIAVSDRIARWKQPLIDISSQFPNEREKIEVISLSGPAGTGQGFENLDMIRKNFADELGLNPSGNWHCNRMIVVGYGGFLAQLTGHLGKVGKDLSLMSQQGIEEVVFKDGGSSSAMKHKCNPVGAEVLVALAQYNAAQLGGLSHAMIHEQERSGAAWTLEWLILPQIISATEASLNLAKRTLASIERLGREQL